MAKKNNQTKKKTFQQPRKAIKRTYHNLLWLQCEGVWMHGLKHSETMFWKKYCKNIWHNIITWQGNYILVCVRVEIQGLSLLKTFLQSISHVFDVVTMKVNENQNIYPG